MEIVFPEDTIIIVTERGGEKERGGDSELEGRGAEGEAEEENFIHVYSKWVTIGRP